MNANRRGQHSFLGSLARLGFASYADYLNSALWAGIRRRTYDLKGRICCRCKVAASTQIHHTDYSDDTLAGLTLDGLMPVCRECHRAIHGIGAKTRPAQAIKGARSKGQSQGRKKPKRKLRPLPGQERTRRGVLWKRNRNPSSPPTHEQLLCRVCRKNWMRKIGDRVMICTGCRVSPVSEAKRAAKVARRRKTEAAMAEAQEIRRHQMDHADSPLRGLVRRAIIQAPHTSEGNSTAQIKRQLSQCGQGSKSVAGAGALSSQQDLDGQAVKGQRVKTAGRVPT